MSLLLQDTLVISPATVQRINAEIEEIKNNTDVADVVASKAELDAYDTSRLTDNAIIKVLQDKSEDDASTYYRYTKSSNTFELIGSVGPYYTKAESNNIEAQIRKDFTDADTTLQNNIDAEKTRATGVENQLRTDLTAETTRATGKETELNTAITTHTSNTSNPHSVTKVQVGLGNVDNTSDVNKPISTATQTALNSKVDKVTTASKVYGTDTTGAQTTYNVNSFGKVDDVQVNGVSVVTNKIANVTVQDLLPDQTGNAGKFLTTDGTDASWSDITKVNTTITLAAADWSSNTQTVSVTGMTATGIVFVSPDPTDQSAYTSAGILCTAQAAGSLSFSCDTVPSGDLSVNIVML